MSKNNNQDSFKVKSRKKNRFTQIDNEILDCITFDYAIDKLVYIVLERFNFYDETSTVKPSIGTIAAMCATKSKNTIRDSIKRLVDMDLVEVEEGGKKANGEFHPNTYWLLEIPETIRYNSIDNEVAVEKKRQRDRERKNTKKLMKEENKKVVKGSSKNEPPKNNEKGSSKNELGSSKNEPGSSNFEGNNNTSFNTSFNTYISSSSNAINYYKESKGIKRISKDERTQIEQWVSILGEHGHAIFIEAIRIAIKADKVELRYIEGILNKWHEFGVKQVEDIDAYTEDFKRKQQEKNNRPNGRKIIRKDPVPEWKNKPDEEVSGQTENNIEAEKKFEAIMKQYKRA
ncbi:DnaD domain protein (plasmid) [Bacillus tropicus]|uniref:DnaD domain-containing protein n=1 Tax=Bacillus tropicus TaxID=2026188 RepID=UPI002003DC0B|nr:DnaD domain protein [Bacillus tropicus]UOK49485.1 DnaD domain protein [Bacillus tropicus]